MYIEIQQLKEKGFTISQIARNLGISRPTVYEY
ncbi:helix-turn-helix domain-containing protein, partial [Anaerobranca gottschalkii]